MAIQREEAVIDITVNKKAAQFNVEELSAEIQQLTGRLREMHREEDPQQFDKMVRSLTNAKEAFKAESDIINGGTIALKKFKQEFIDGQKAVEVAATNNPVKKYAVEARSSFESFSNSVSKSAVGDKLKSIKGIFSGTDASNSPFFAYISIGLKTASNAADNYKSRIDLLREAIIENKSAQEGLQIAMAANVAEQEAVNAQLLINIAAQEESAAAVAAATTMDEAQAAVLANKKLKQEADTLATQLATLAQNEKTIAIEADTVAIEAQTLATELGTGALRIFKVALATTGIGLFLIAVASLVAYFAETNEGSKKFQVLMAQLNALFQECMKLIAPIGKAIYDTFTQSNGPIMVFTALLKNALLPMATIFKVFSDIKNGNFKDAFVDIKNAMASWSDNNVDVFHGIYTSTVDLASNLSKAADQIKKVDTSFAGAAASAKAVTEARQQLTIAERAWSIEKTKQVGQVALLTKQLRDQNLSEQDRMALAEKAKSIREQIYQGDLAIAQKNEALVNREQDLRSKKDLQAITDAKNRVQEVTNTYLTQDQNITNRESMLNKRQATRAQSNQKAYDNLLATAKSFYTAAEVDRTSANDREVAAVEKKYTTLITSLNTFLTRKGLTEQESAGATAMIAAAEAAKTKEVQDLRVKQEQILADKIKAFHQQIADVQATELEKEIDRINSFYNQQVILAGTNAEQIKAIELARAQDISTAKLQEEHRLQLEILNIKEEGAATDDDKQKVKLEKINQHYDDELEALKKKFSKDLQATQAFKDAEALILANKSGALRVAEAEDPTETKKTKAKTDQLKKQSELEKKVAQETANSLFTIGSRNRQAETDSKIKNLEAQAQIDLTTGNKTAAQKQAIQDKLAKDEAKVKLAAWKADRTAAIEQAIINGALAMTKVAAQTGVLSFAFDPIIAAETAAQVLLISTQKEPKFAKGGVIDGPSHSAGGVPLVDGNTGRAIAEVEGDETVAVFSKEATKNNGWLINQLLFSSMFRNGAKVDVGSITNGVKLEKGGPLAMSAAGAQYTSTTTQINQSLDTDKIVAELTLTRQAIKDQKVWLNRAELEEFDRKEAVIIKRATV